MLSIIILDCLNKLKAERSSSAIYHLLLGKRSSQTIQDAHGYSMENYFGIYPKISKVEIDTIILDLYNQGLIKKQTDEHYLVTDLGKTRLVKQLKAFPELNYLKGIYYCKEDQIFWERLLLFVQTASNIVNNQHEFLPVSEKEEVTRWVKQFYSNKKNQLESLLDRLYEELNTLLEMLPDRISSVLVYRMTGYHRIGFTKNQLAEKFQCTVDDVAITLKMGIHFFIYHVREHQKQFKYLRLFLMDLFSDEVPLSNSTKQTLTLLEKGLTIQKISQQRNLKENTVCDHIVEIALSSNNFSIRPFISEVQERQILSVAKQLNTQKLKNIKRVLEEDISYFQIRLVLAAYNDHLKELST